MTRELAIAAWRVNQTTITGANWDKLKTVSQIVAMPTAVYAYALLIAPLGKIWQIPSIIGFWVSVTLILISGGIYLLPQNSTKENPQLNTKRT